MLFLVDVPDIFNFFSARGGGITLPQKESGKRSPAKGVWQKSDEKSDKSVRKSDRKVTESVPKTKKSDRTPFAALLLRHPEGEGGVRGARKRGGVGFY